MENRLGSRTGLMCAREDTCRSVVLLGGKMGRAVSILKNPNMCVALAFFGDFAHEYAGSFSSGRDSEHAVLTVEMSYKNKQDFEGGRLNIASSCRYRLAVFSIWKRYEFIRRLGGDKVCMTLLFPEILEFTGRTLHMLLKQVKAFEKECHKLLLCLVETGDGGYQHFQTCLLAF